MKKQDKIIRISIKDGHAVKKISILDNCEQCKDHKYSKDEDEAWDFGTHECKIKKWLINERDYDKGCLFPRWCPLETVKE